MNPWVICLAFVISLAAGQEIDYDSFDAPSFDQVAESAATIPAEGAAHWRPEERHQCGPCVKEECVSPENCLAGTFVWCTF